MSLAPGDVEAIARRVAELLDQRREQPLRYLDAGQLAQMLGVERDWVYVHARQLGAIRLGGPHGRLRFDLHHVQCILAATDRAEDQDRPRAHPGRRRPTSVDGVELIPYAS